MPTIEQAIIEKLETVEAHLIKDGVSEYYKGITKSINILKCRDRKAYCKISRHLQDDFRMLYDNGHGDQKLDADLDAACNLCKKL